MHGSGRRSNTESFVSGVARTNRNPARDRPGWQGGGGACSTAGARVMPAKGRSPGSRTMRKRGKAMTTDKSLSGSEKVQRLQTVLHSKAKEKPERRFHTLIDKVGVRISCWKPGSRSAVMTALTRWSGRPSQTSRRLAWNAGTGTEGWNLRTKTGAAAADPEETARQVPALGDSLHTGSGSADVVSTASVQAQ